MSRSVWDPLKLAHPWFARVADLVARVANERTWPSVAMLDECFAPELRRAGVRLVEAAKPGTRARRKRVNDPRAIYELRIVDDGEVPTRPNNAHDLLNTLVWAAFPRAKLALSRALAAAQRERIADRDRMPPIRTRAHDRLACLDEGAILHVTGRATSTWIFGHAIYEHAYAGDTGVRGAAVDLVVDGDHVRAAIDDALAAASFEEVVRRGAGVAVESIAPARTIGPQIR